MNVGMVGVRKDYCIVSMDLMSVRFRGSQEYLARLLSLVSLKKMMRMDGFVFDKRVECKHQNGCVN